MNFAFKTKPFRHQMDGLNRARGKSVFAYNCEMGTGKTWMVINEAAMLWGEGRLAALLVFAPSGVHTNWTLREIPTHMPDWVRYRAASWNASAPKKAAAETAKILQRDQPNELRVLTMNWEALSTKRGYQFAMMFCESAGTLMIACDESHKIKNPSAQRTKALMKLKPYSNFRRIMTGTPITNSPFDLFSQYTFLSRDILGTTSYFAFKAEYAQMLQAGDPRLSAIMRKTASGRVPQVVATGPDGRPLYKNLDRLERLTAPHTFRVRKKDCLDLPEKVYMQSFYELTPKQRKAYDLAKEKARVVLEDNTVKAMERLAAVMKMSQICSGWFIVPGTDLVQRIGENPKMDLFKERIDDSVNEQGNKVIVWARFHEEINEIIQELSAMKIKAVQYHGKINKEDRDIAIDSFNNGDASVFVGQQDAGGTGLTLNAASHVIYYSNTFNAADRWQSEDRCHRIGQDKTVVYEDLIGHSTIDEKIIAALRSKKNVADIITGDFRLL